MYDTPTILSNHDFFGASRFESDLRDLVTVGSRTLTERAT
jgi:hypothetical protein